MPVIISHKYKFVFIHNPKTAGTSIANTLLSYALENRGDIFIDVFGVWDNITSIDRDLNPFITKDKRFRSHIKAKQLKSIFDKQKWPWDKYFKFGFVRNPFDRCISEYNYLMQYAILNNKDTKSKWAKTGSAIFQYNIKAFIAHRVYPTPHLQWKYFFDKCNKNNLLDYVGKFENLESDWNNIVKQIGLPLNKLKLKHLKPTVRKNYREYFDEKMVDFFYNTYKIDIELGNYKF